MNFKEQAHGGNYPSQRDLYHPDYEPIDINTIERISSVPYFDTSYWSGMFTADMWDEERLKRMIRKSCMCLCDLGIFSGLRDELFFL